MFLFLTFHILSVISFFTSCVLDIILISVPWDFRSYWLNMQYSCFIKLVKLVILGSSQIGLRLLILRSSYLFSFILHQILLTWNHVHGLINNFRSWILSRHSHDLVLWTLYWYNFSHGWNWPSHNASRTSISG